MKKVNGLVAATAGILSILSVSNAHAGIGVISLIGGPGGLVLIETGGAMILGSVPITAAGCFVAAKVAPDSAWADQENCGMFVNALFWPGLLLLDANDTAAPQSLDALTDHIATKYGAPNDDAMNVADLMYDKALKASKTQSSDPNAPIPTFTISQDELDSITSPAFQAAPGFQQLAKDLI
jgi:hypothetical protein